MSTIAHGTTLCFPLRIPNWIPIDWPARRVTCIVNITNTIGSYTIAMPNFIPADVCRFTLINRKVGSTNCQIKIVAPDGTTMASSVVANQSFRIVEFIWSPATDWYCTAQTFSSMLLPYNTRPVGTTFLPTTIKPVSP